LSSTICTQKTVIDQPEQVVKCKERSLNPKRRKETYPVDTDQRSNMSNPLQTLSQTLTASISPDSTTRRQAEEALRQGESAPGFLLLVLQLVNSSEVDLTVRQTGGVYFKNAVKRLWAGEEVSLFGSLYEMMC
jgi:hypothetical protein